jgi:hypothetical protein
MIGEKARGTTAGRRDSAIIHHQNENTSLFGRGFEISRRSPPVQPIRTKKSHARKHGLGMKSRLG